MAKELKGTTVKSQQELFVLAINPDTSYPQLDVLLGAFENNEQRIGALEKALGCQKGEQIRKTIYSLLGKYHDIYGWEKSLSSTGKPLKERLQIKKAHYKQAVFMYINAGYSYGSKGEISRLANMYSKLSFVCQELGDTDEFIEYSKKADEFMIKCGRKRLRPQTKPLTEQEKMAEVEKSKQPHAIP